MTPPPIQLSDDDIADLVRAAFTAREHLADPDRAVAIAATPGHPRHRGRMVLGAAAAVALVAGGATYALSQRPGATSPQGVVHGPPAAEHVPPLPPLQTDAVNRAKATAAALAVLARMRAYPGATTSGRIAAFSSQGAMIASTPGYTVTRTRWWKVGPRPPLPVRSGPRAVARWYAGHPTRGFGSESGKSVSSSSDGTTTVYAADFAQPGNDGLPPRGVSIEVQTVRLPSGVGIRASVLSVWQPARPRASFVQDATSIDVHSVHTRYGRTSHTTTRSFTVRDHQKVLAAEIAFDGLEGTGPIVVSCPMMLDSYRDRIVFHTPTGDVVVTSGGGCVDIGSVQRDGKVVGPGLAFVSQLLDTLGLHS